MSPPREGEKKRRQQYRTGGCEKGAGRRLNSEKGKSCLVSKGGKDRVRRRGGPYISFMGREMGKKEKRAVMARAGEKPVTPTYHGRKEKPATASSTGGGKKGKKKGIHLHSGRGGGKWRKRGRDRKLREKTGPSANEEGGRREDPTSSRNPGGKSYSHFRP